jgi:hypothetical protein
MDDLEQTTSSEDNTQAFSFPSVAPFVAPEIAGRHWRLAEFQVQIGDKR